MNPYHERSLQGQAKNSSALTIFALTVMSQGCGLALSAGGSGFDRQLTKAASVMSEKMADLVLVSMAEPQGKCFWRF